MATHKCLVAYGTEIFQTLYQNVLDEQTRGLGRGDVGHRSENFE